MVTDKSLRAPARPGLPERWRWRWVGPAFSLVALGVCLAAASSTARGEDSFTPRTTIAYTPLQVWDSGLVRQLGVQPGAIYVIGTLDPYGRVVQIREPYVARHATIAPDAGRIAFAGTLGQRMSEVDGVHVVDSSGVVLASFPGAVGYRWSPEGALLAVQFSRADSGQISRNEGLLLWSRTSGATTSLPVWADELQWISETSLLARAGTKVRRIELGSRFGTWSVRPSEHRGVDLSPDGRYSLQHAGRWNHPTIIDEKTGNDLTACATRLLWRGAFENRIGEYRMEPDWGWNPDLYLAHWVRLPGADHLLCGTVLVGPCYGDCPGVPSPANCRTVVFDVETGDVVATYPGYAMGPSADRRGAMRLTPEEGVEVSDVFLGTAAYRSVDRTLKTARQRARVDVETFEVRTLGRMHERVRLNASPVDVGPGDWLPSLIPNVSICDRAFRVVEIPSSGRVLIQYDGTRWTRLRSGGIAIADDTTATARGVVMNEGLVLSPRRLLYGFRGQSPYEVRLRTRPNP